MGNNYHADLVNLSQINTNIFKQFNVISIRKRFLGIIKIYKIKIPPNDLHNVIVSVQANMSKKLNKEWYVSFYNTEQIIVVFRKKIFELSTNGITPIYMKKLDTTNATDKEKWDEMINYAKSLHIPDNQLDFLSPNFRTETY
jgi:hypothetical protein